MPAYYVLHNGTKINEHATMDSALADCELCTSIGYTNLTIVRLSDGKEWIWN